MKEKNCKANRRREFNKRIFNVSLMFGLKLLETYLDYKKSVRKCNLNRNRLKKFENSFV